MIAVGLVAGIGAPDLMKRIERSHSRSSQPWLGFMH
jgi:hypothetical protein